MLRALIWDVDGTIAETEADGHRVAFNQAFEAFGLPWRWDVAHYGRLLRVTGGRERLLHDFAGRADAPPPGAEREQLARALHLRKNGFYAERVAAGLIVARPGVLRLMRQAHESGLQQAIATTTSRSNVDALMRRLLGAQWRDGFAAVLCGEDVAQKKPHPEVYLKALAALRCDASAALALEDSDVGVRAAADAGVAALQCPSVYFGASAHTPAWRVCADLDQAPAPSAGMVDPQWLRSQWSDRQPALAR